MYVALDKNVCKCKCNVYVVDTNPDMLSRMNR